MSLSFFWRKSKLLLFVPVFVIMQIGRVYSVLRMSAALDVTYGHSDADIRYVSFDLKNSELIKMVDDCSRNRKKNDS